MRKYIIYIVNFIGAALLQTGCYDDKGDYDYHDVNMMEIVIPETKLRMPKEKAVEVSIMPQISQTLEQNEENLEFQWKRLNPNATLGSDRLADYTDYSVGKECTITVEPNESNNIGLMLVVLDKRNGTTWYQTGEIAIIRPLNPCWFVLQEKEGKGVLGAIEGTPEGYYVYPDVFRSELNLSFPLEGKPLAVSARKDYGNSTLKQMLGFFGFTVSPALMLVTNQDLALLTPSTLITKYPSDKILFEPIEKGEPLNIGYYKMNAHGELFVNSGKAYCALMDGFCVPFSVIQESGLPVISAYGSYGKNFLFFDSENHCFLRSSVPNYMAYMSNQATQNIRRYGTKWSDQKPVQTYFMSSNELDAFDPNKIDPSLEMRDIVTGGSQGDFAYAIAAPQNGQELTVFKFSDEDPVCAARYRLALPSEVNIETTKFIASYAYTANLVFMASGNKLYRIDLDRGRAVELYQYEADPSAQITCLKFKDAENEEELGMSLGLGINTADKGVVVELQLTVAGDVAREENSICVYEDPEQPIGKIVDISYNYE